VVVKAGVLVAPIVVKRTPFVPAVVLLQFKVLEAHGTALLPFVMSLKTHPTGGGCVGSVRRLELHDLLAAVCAILYSTKLALPWRLLLAALASPCSTIAKTPAKLGADAEVPPTPKKLKEPVGLQELLGTASASQTT
jgi:hypothetical protein